MRFSDRVKTAGVTIPSHVSVLVEWVCLFAVGVVVAVAVGFGVSTVPIVVVLVSSTATVVVAAVSSAATIFVVVVAHVADHVLQFYHALVHFIDCRVACG
jgi:hypothetical protein